MTKNILKPFPNNKFYTLPDSKSLQTTISNVMTMAESSPNGQKTLCFQKTYTANT